MNLSRSQFQLFQKILMIIQTLIERMKNKLAHLEFNKRKFFKIKKLSQTIFVQMNMQLNKNKITQEIIKMKLII